MKKVAKVAAVVLVLVTLISIGQSTAMAAPTRGAAQATTRASGAGLYQNLMRLLAAVWGGGHSAVWGGGHSAVWGGQGNH